MRPESKSFLFHLPAALILYATVIVYQGYQYGQGDQTQILPCLWAQDHPGAYTQDHYVQHYLASGINERTIFHFLLRHLGYDQPWIVFIWHAISGIGLILGLISIASVFIKRNVWQWLSVGMILTLGFHTSTGSNELYYNLLIPSLPAKALAAWAIYFWLRNKYSAWALLLIAAGYLQPLVGIQVFLLTTIAMIIERWRNKNTNPLPLKLILLYLIATVPWLVLLAMNNGSHSDPVSFMQIMEFRLSHHFFATYFGLIHLLFWTIFAFACIYFYTGKMKWMCIAIFAGCAFYEIGVEVMRLPIALYTQWWKTTIWLEAFAFIALFVQLEKLGFLNNLFKKYSLVLPLLFWGLVCFYRLSGLFGERPDDMLPWVRSKSEEVEISELARQLTPENAVFIIPPDLTAFRWYSKRSLYVDYKAMIHNESFLTEWLERIVNVYAYDLKSKQSGIDFYRHANEVLSAPSGNLIDSWKKSGITYIISTDPTIANLELIMGNKAYHIYKIPE
ncbi:MAG TPA: DUF6798 domain-containing protein [Saprospiraceae bacterium]|nr:DUF6798 domain-containing protein [Saprospiraceae bacterium]